MAGELRNREPVEGLVVPLLPGHIGSWDELFLGICELVARKSKDPSTQTGCVVVDRDLRIRSTGFNGFPRGVPDDPAWYADRDKKLALIAHCDANAVYSAARTGTSLSGCTMYLTAPPCSECCKAITQAGIVEVVYPLDNQFDRDPARRARWAESFENARILLDGAGVKVRKWSPEK